jgi:hypothetical protein
MTRALGGWQVALLNQQGGKAASRDVVTNHAFALFENAIGEKEPGSLMERASITAETVRSKAA